MQYALESFAKKSPLIKLQGWAFHETGELISASLLCFENGKLAETHPVEFPVYRKEIGQRLPDRTFSSRSGFSFYGALSNDACNEFEIEFVHDNGEKSLLKIPQEALLQESVSHPFSVREIAKKVKNSIKKKSFARDVKLASKILILPKIENAISEILAPFSRAPEKSILLIDHSLGGGANYFSNRLANSLSADNRIVELSYSLHRLCYTVRVREGRRRTTKYFERIVDAFLCAKTFPFEEVILNNTVAFPDPDKIKEIFVHFAKSSTRSKIVIHDFHVVCPSHHLLDWNGTYCGVPDHDICDKCLPKNRYGYTTLTGGRDIKRWRELWFEALQSADSIVVFSNSSEKIIRKAFSDLATKIVVSPHKHNDFSDISLAPVQTSKMKIGVVGNISFVKGSEVINSLAAQIRDMSLDIEIVIIGSIHSLNKQNEGIVSQTGPYSHKNLPSVIAESGANIFLFPSICPETYSFVCQEIMNLRLPLAVFNLGAPAERVSNYSRGHILGSMQPSKVLLELCDFFKSIKEEEKL